MIEQSRDRIAAAARECFAAEGYEKATIRGIAAAAGVDPAMVMRQYGNKAALFTAVADFELRLPDLTGTPPETLGRRLAEHFVHRWKENDAFTALLRASTSNEVAADRLRDIFQQQIALLTARNGPDLDSALTRAGMIASQVLGVALCRYILHLSPLADMPDEELTAWLGDTLQRYLNEPLPVLNGQ